MVDSRFPKECRIRRSSDFRRCYLRRCSVADDVLIVYGCENDLPFARLGLSVSRKVGGAVVRNRWKRVLREAFRLSRGELPRGVDLVIIPRPDVPAESARARETLLKLAALVSKKLARNPRRDGGGGEE
jgi:ribonuclease P protein component